MFEILKVPYLTGNFRVVILYTIECGIITLTDVLFDLPDHFVYCCH